jgi:calcium/calmodulin-dependent protein kinase I/calcium-dependent protein kinase
MANFNGYVDLTRLNFTLDCLELLRGMLEPNPIRRFSIEQI